LRARCGAENAKGRRPGVLCPLPSASALGQLDLGDVAGLRAFRTVNDLELDRHALFERPEAVALDRRVVDEDIAASVALDESVTLGVVEPLDFACDAHRSVPACFDAMNRRVVEPAPATVPEQKKRPQYLRPFP